jgi:hypothetical protein
VRTLLSQFCEEFGQVAKPLIDPLTAASDTLTAVGSTTPVREILPDLLDSAHQLRSLAQKVEEQQAYVLIFGPLKSGKSTLMNAIAASYVSEVTTLPAYPCMVFVSYSEQREYQIERYNGRVDTLHDQAALRMHVNRAHNELAENIREVERTGADFDPGTHFPDAIRRIDVRVPAQQLKESGTVVVDTPGLYTKMKFGYGRMTKEFRNTATCAIFVVKTDNLFLEQVFDEFHQLLEIFSRIFLVVNLDTTKKDLRPDGSLVPSLESEDPLRLIEAFENLSMNTPLKEAAEDGRLKIYPADLMNAASNRLAAAHGDTVEAEAGLQSNFDNFLGDLTEYLNSTDYLVAFLGDSLRQADSLVSQLGELIAHPTVKELNQHFETLEQRVAQAEREQEAVGSLQQYDWGGAFENLPTWLSELSSSDDEDLYTKTSQALGGAVTNWFSESSSLRTLVNDDLGLLMRSMQAEVISNVTAHLRRRIHQGSVGVELPANVDQTAAAAGLDLKAVGRTAMEQLDGGAALEDVHIPLAKAAIPVRKGFWDFILFRNQPKMRARLFGAKAEHRLDKNTKSKRLGEAARSYMQAEVEDHLYRYYPKANERLAGWISQSFAHYAVTDILAQLETAAANAQQKLAQAQSELDQVAQLRQNLVELDSAIGSANNGFEELSKSYGDTRPEMLLMDLDAGESANAVVETIEAQVADSETEELVLEEPASE